MTEVYVVLDKPVYEPGSKLGVVLLGYSTVEKPVHVEVVGHRGVLAEASVKLSPKPGAVRLFEVDAPRIPGRYELSLRVDGGVVDRVEYLVIPRDELGADRYLAFVWHNHQAPNVLPSGVYKYLWGVVHTSSDELAPYGKGPYHYHAVMLEKYPGYRCTFNLSPSLLYQWSELVEKGLKHGSGYVAPGSPEAGYVREALELYRKAASRGQVDVLTSVYAHTILGYLVEYLGAEDIVRGEVEYGAEVTRRVVGVEPKGVWTPEMAFHMKLVDVYSEFGLEYTVLDARCHLEKSEGDVATHLEPYRVRGDRGEVVVFFRDTELSNHVSFKNSFTSPLHAWRLAYDFALKASMRLRLRGVLTIALDGENWMVFSKNPPLTAVFYDRLLAYLTRLQEAGYLKTAHLRELVKMVEVRRTLKRIPTASWLCGFAKWCGERAEQPVYWERVRALYQRLLDYEKVRGRDERSARARHALWHALDSDYWWAEFWEPTLITAWLEEAEKALAVTS